MNVNRLAEFWARNGRRSDEFGLAVEMGALWKLPVLVIWGLVPGTILGVAMAFLFVLVRAGRWLARSGSPESIGWAPAVAIGALASVLLILPLGTTGCYALIGLGFIVVMARRALGSVGR